MFSKEEVAVSGSGVFNIITADEYDVTIMSRNTGHYWYLHNPEYPDKGTIIILHRHKGSHQYHLNRFTIVEF